MKINYIYRRYEHHSIRSGYEQLIQHVRAPKNIINYEGLRNSWMPWPLTKRFVDHAGLRSYIPRSFYAELEVIKKVFCSKNQIHHFLYGEDACRYSLWFRGINKNRIIVTYHHPPYIFEEFVKNSRIPKLVDAIIVTCHYSVPYYQSLCGDKKKVFMVPLGIDTEYYNVPDDHTKKERVCVFCGFYLRDFKMMQEVVKIVGDKDKTIKFNIITSQKYQEYFRSCPNVIFEHGISVQELVDRYHRAKMLVMPFEETTSNTAVTEALACGLPVVTNDIGGIRDYVDEHCGVITPEKDTNALAAAVIDLMNDDQKWQRLSKGARKKAEMLDWKNVARQTRDVYNQVLAN